MSAIGRIVWPSLWRAEAGLESMFGPLVDRNGPLCVGSGNSNRDIVRKRRKVYHALGKTLKQRGANAAVTVVHTGIEDIGALTRRADVVVAAVGVPAFVKPDMIRPGAVVVSGGITWEGKKLLADVDEACGEVASWITPRLGGVGPTTVAMLLRNTVDAAERSLHTR